MITSLSQPSWGERLLPLLFAAMETCWIDAILIGLASSNLLGLNQPLLPLWIPFVLIAGFYYANHRGTKPLRIALTVVAMGYVVWASVYAGKSFLFDPGWILNLPDTLAQVNAQSFQIVTVAISTYALCRRGSQLAKYRINPAQVSRVIRFGSIVIVALVILRAIAEQFSKHFSDDGRLLLLIALFFCLSLIAHALSRLAFVRFHHPTGLSGSIHSQERVVVQVILVASMAFLLFALIVNSLFLGNLLSSVQRWLAQALQTLTTRLKAPSRYRAVPPPTPCHSGPHCPNPPATHPVVGTQSPPVAHPTTPLSNYLSAQVVAILSILLVILLITAVMLVLVLLVRRGLKLRSRRLRETHESVWSWRLFWEQFKAFLLMLPQRLLGRLPFWRASRSHNLPAREVGNDVPAANTMREIYRRLLTDAAKLGHPRAPTETPYEFVARLAQQFPFVEPQLLLITEVYTLTRYSGSIPEEAEVAQMRNLLLMLEQKGFK